MTGTEGSQEKFHSSIYDLFMRSESCSWTNVDKIGRLADCHPGRLSTANAFAAPTPAKSWGISLIHCRATTLYHYNSKQRYQQGSLYGISYVYLFPHAFSCLSISTRISISGANFRSSCNQQREILSTRHQSSNISRNKSNAQCWLNIQIMIKVGAAASNEPHEPKSASHPQPF